MACERYRDALSEHAAGVPAGVDLEAHLGTCAECCAELATLQRALVLVDAELGELGAAQPAPGFDARVRAAVSAAAGERPRPWLWPALAAAALALVAVGLAVGRARAPEPLTTVPLEPRAARTSPTPEPTPEPARAAPTGAPAPVRAEVSPAARTAPRRRPEPREAEVLVPPGEGEALLRLVALVRRERVVPQGLRSAGQPSADLAELPPVDIQPLEIVPLDPAEASGT